MQRVAIVGCGGAGKSTLARQVGDLTGLPVFHLDALLWKPGWVMTPRDEEDRIQREVAAQERWVIDGNYGRTIPIRFAAADTLVFLDMPRHVCLRRVLWRRIRYNGRTRPDMTPGCIEQADWEFLKWIWDFGRDTRPRLLEQLEKFRAGRDVFVLRSAAEVADFLSRIKQMK